MGNTCPVCSSHLSHRGSKKAGMTYYCRTCNKVAFKLPPKLPAFTHNQVLCLPFLQFVEKHPEVLDRRRFRWFEQIGYDCVTCGLIGSHIVWWKENNEYEANHYDLAGYNDRGKLKMITFDHIYPRSRGGRDTIENMQPMCSDCNKNKSDKIPDDIDISKLIKKDRL